MKNLQDLFLDSLADIYDAENHLVRALPKMAKAATHTELQEAFESHLEETEGHVRKVESVFAEFGQKAKAKKCEAIVGLVKEANEMASENKGSPSINAALIAAAQKVEHYEIATYGTLQEWARLLGQEAASDTLGEILDEEKHADAALSELARNRCNASAGSESGDSEVSSGKRSRNGNRSTTTPVNATRG